MKAAVLGFGTVGAGVYEMLCEADSLEAGSVLVRPGKDDAPFKRSSMEAVLADPSLDAVAEAMGGIEPAFSYLREAILAGKHAVTSNKALVAEKGIELAALAREKGVSFLFSAACGGGVPFLHNLALAAQTDEILSVGGILNGTTNFILDRMQRTGAEYGEALSEAQKLGYAEADPTADVSGLDALRKLILACAVAYNLLPVSGMDCEGIESFTGADVGHIRSMGLSCRLMVSGARSGNCLSAYVQPELFPPSAPECSVLENYNMAKYLGKRCGSIVLIGQGAGRYPTASAVVRDLYCCGDGHVMLQEGCEKIEADNSVISCCYYVRLPVRFKSALPVAELYSEENGVLRIKTAPVSVSEMHRFAKQIREEGADLFFASMG